MSAFEIYLLLRWAAFSDYATIIIGICGIVTAAFFIKRFFLCTLEDPKRAPINSWHNEEDRKDIKKEYEKACEKARLITKMITKLSIYWFIIFIISICLWVITPTRTDLAVIYGGSFFTNQKDISAIPINAAKAANKFLTHYIKKGETK